MGLFKSGPREKFVTAWGVTFIDPMTRAPIHKVLVTLTSHKVEIADYDRSASASARLWVRKLDDLQSVQVDGNQLMAIFADRRGYQAMAFDFTVSDADDASAAAAQMYRTYQARMAGLGRPALATITPLGLTA